mmetsp:Transcript_139872/g.198092  ORF Transcript_139872/g.198092 Transcript_139872/m.198092 type:complete len:93 (+) Transcript_139872:261-539(+)
MMSELRIVVSRWAMETVVMLCPFWFRRDSNVSWTMRSDSLSRAEVASSRSKIWGFFAKARAMASRCRWPPESKPPPAPTKVSNLSGSPINVS